MFLYIIDLEVVSDTNHYVIAEKRKHGSNSHLWVLGRKHHYGFERLISLHTLSLYLHNKAYRLTAHEKCSLKDSGSEVFLL